jgi:ParB family chromosome partitioning protein
MAQPRDEGHLIHVDGKRGRLIEALVHFDGEEQPRMVRFTN